MEKKKKKYFCPSARRDNKLESVRVRRLDVGGKQESFKI